MNSIVAARHDVRLETVRAQIAEQLDLRLIDELRVRPVELRMTRSREPLADRLVVGSSVRHAAVGRRDELHQLLLLARERGLVARHSALNAGLFFHSGCFGAAAFT